MSETILIVEDDESVAEGLREILSGYGYQVLSAADNRGALELFRRESIDLIVLDVSLGKDSGYDLCRQIRERGETPVLFLTACSSEIEVVRGFQAGGDDYVVKPFRMQELLMRIRALLRRAGRSGRFLQRSGSLVCDRESREFRKDGTPLDLTATEWKLVSALIGHWPQALSREELLYLVWDRDASFVEANTLSVNVSRLREKLGEFQGAPYIETVRGVGYRWAVPVTR